MSSSKAYAIMVGVRYFSGFGRDGRVNMSGSVAGAWLVTDKKDFREAGYNLCEMGKRVTVVEVAGVQEGGDAYAK